MNAAFGNASRMCRAKPSMKSYWLPVRFVGNDDNVAPFRKHGVAIAFLLGKGFLDRGEHHAACLHGEFSS